jgi:hypothetical protein
MAVTYQEVERIYRSLEPDLQRAVMQAPRKRRDGPRAPGVCLDCGTRDVQRFTKGIQLCVCAGCLR